jgi:ceramide glucosyltransferase
MRGIAAGVLALILAGSWVYCVLVILAVHRYLAASRLARHASVEPISILKPLHGLDEGLESNLRTFFEQDYGKFEILFAARSADDACWLVVERLRAEFPLVPVRTFLTGDPPYPNAKVWSLDHMMRAAANDLLVMSDSDIRVDRNLLHTIGAEFLDAGLGVATCPYRAVPGRGIWSTLEAIGMNTEFWGGAFTARLVEKGVRFAIGPTLAARRSVIESIGGWERLSQYLAEDFVLGQFAAEAGHGVILSGYVVEHHIGSQPWLENFAHRLRWNRSTRRSRPAGYVGQLFINPLPIALALTAVLPAAWPALAATAFLRAAAARAVSEDVLHDPLCRRHWFLVPIQDLLSFGCWIAGFFGSTILWRGLRYRVLPDGKFSRV